VQISKIDVEYAWQEGFSSLTSNGMRHIKVLPYLSVVQAVEGSYAITLGKSNVYNTGSGGYFIAPAGIRQTIVHNADPITGRMTCRWVFLKVKINNTDYLDDIFTFPALLPDAAKEEMNRIFDRLFAAQTVVDQYICYYQIIKLLLNLSSEKGQKQTANIARAIAFINEHYQEKITVQELAEELNLSASHFFSIFKKAMGVSPIAYLNHYRLSRAAELLVGTDITISEIANSVGITDAVYFDKLFKRTFQVSPTAYRKNYKDKSTEGGTNHAV